MLRRLKSDERPASSGKKLTSLFQKVRDSGSCADAQRFRSGTDAGQRQMALQSERRIFLLRRRRLKRRSVCPLVCHRQLRANLSIRGDLRFRLRQKKHLNRRGDKLFSFFRFFSARKSAYSFALVDIFAFAFVDCRQGEDFRNRFFR